MNSFADYYIFNKYIGICALNANKLKDAPNEGLLYATLFYFLYVFECIAKRLHPHILPNLI